MERIAHLLDRLPFTCWARLWAGANTKDLWFMVSGIFTGYTECRHERIGGPHGGCYCGKWIGGQCTRTWTQTDVDAWHARAERSRDHA